MELTLDINILMIGTGMSDSKCLPCHINLLSAFDKIVLLALDNDGHIKQLYKQKLGSASAGNKWLVHKLTSDRCRFFPLAKLKKSTKTKLDDEHFDWEDVKYVKLAASTPSKCLVTEDPDFSRPICKILKDEEGVFVHNSEAACATIEANIQAS